MTSPECRIDSDCGPNLACIRQECVNPCLNYRPCSSDQECSVASNGGGQKQVTCTCPPGTIYGVDGRCSQVTQEPECRSDYDCPDPEVCQSGSCQDACAAKRCGQFAFCTARNHQARCQCQHGYTGNPDAGCKPRKYSDRFLCALRSVQFILFFPSVAARPPVSPVEVGCSSDSECPDYAACRNRQCINPCAHSNPCAPTAFCKVVHHQAVCTCPDGYVGSPEVDCRRREYPTRTTEEKKTLTKSYYCPTKQRSPFQMFHEVDSK